MVRALHELWQISQGSRSCQITGRPLVWGAIAFCRRKTYIFSSDEFRPVNPFCQPFGGGWDMPGLGAGRSGSRVFFGLPRISTRRAIGARGTQRRRHCQVSLCGNAAQSNQVTVAGLAADGHRLPAEQNQRGHRPTRRLTRVANFGPAARSSHGGRPGRYPSTAAVTAPRRRCGSTDHFHFAWTAGEFGHVSCRATGTASGVVHRAWTERRDGALARTATRRARPHGAVRAEFAAG